MRMNNKNIFNGIIFILAAIVIIIGSMGLLGGISFWSLLFTVLFVVLLIKSLYKLKWTGILFSIAFLLIIYSDRLGFLTFT